MPRYIFSTHILFMSVSDGQQLYLHISFTRYHSYKEHGEQNQEMEKKDGKIYIKTKHLKQIFAKLYISWFTVYF